MMQGAGERKFWGSGAEPDAGAGSCCTGGQGYQTAAAAAAPRRKGSCTLAAPSLGLTKVARAAVGGGGADHAVVPLALWPYTSDEQEQGSERQCKSRQHAPARALLDVHAHCPQAGTAMHADFTGIPCEGAASSRKRPMARKMTNSTVPSCGLRAQQAASGRTSADAGRQAGGRLGPAWACSLCRSAGGAGAPAAHGPHPGDARLGCSAWQEAQPLGQACWRMPRPGPSLHALPPPACVCRRLLSPPLPACAVPALRAASCLSVTPRKGSNARAAVGGRTR